MKDFQKTLLLDNERNALQEASLFLKEQYPVEQLVLFGSKARGDSDKYSDIDILIISSRVLLWQEEKAIVENLFDIGMKYDVIFSPLFASSQEWNGEVFRVFPVYSEIMREGAFVP